MEENDQTKVGYTCFHQIDQSDDDGQILEDRTHLHHLMCHDLFKENQDDEETYGAVGIRLWELSQDEDHLGHSDAALQKFEEDIHPFVLL